MHDEDPPDTSFARDSQPSYWLIIPPDRQPQEDLVSTVLSGSSDT